MREQWCRAIEPNLFACNHLLAGRHWADNLVREMI